MAEVGRTPQRRPGSSRRAESHAPGLQSQQRLTAASLLADYELAQLQEKLKETEEVMEKIVSNAGDSPDR